MTLQASPEAECRACGKSFLRFRTTATACSPRCALKLVKATKKAEKDDTRARRIALKSLADWRAEAQTAFNRFCRWRDRLAGHRCICCGAPLDWNSTKPGGAVDAGHFVSRGSAIELAFDERNVNAQRKSCNRPGGTTRAKFVAGMTARYGKAVVDELEGPHELPKLKAEDYRAIKAKYSALARDLQSQTETQAHAEAPSPPALESTAEPATDVQALSTPLSPGQVSSGPLD